MFVAIAAWIYAGLAGLVCLFQLGVVLGRPWGHLTMGGRWTGALPPAMRVLPVLSAALVAAMATAVLGGAGQVAWSPAGWVLWSVLGLSILAVIANAATPSRAERRLWLPVTMAMLLAVVIVACGRD